MNRKREIRLSEFPEVTARKMRGTFGALCWARPEKEREMLMKKVKKSKTLPWEEAEGLIRLHQQHSGIYHRVAARLGVDASLVSRVSSGSRNNEAVRRAIVKELSAWHAEHLKLG